MIMTLRPGSGADRMLLAALAKLLPRDLWSIFLRRSWCVASPSDLPAGRARTAAWMRRGNEG
jgi:hypothetical protein